MKIILWIVGIGVVIWYALSKYTVAGTPKFTTKAIAATGNSPAASPSLDAPPSIFKLNTAPTGTGFSQQPSPYTSGMTTGYLNPYDNPAYFSKSAAPTVRTRNFNMPVRSTSFTHLNRRGF